MDTFKVLIRPVSTEKAIRMMESENKMTFVVNKQANKRDVKEAFEEVFKTTVTKVNTLNTPSGEKRAFITLSPDKPALDIATQLGLM